MATRFRSLPQASDAETVQRLCQKTGFFRPDEVAVARELVEERLAKGDSCGYYFRFAEEDDTVKGYVCFGPIPCTLGSFDLYWIVVDPDWQGEGLGRRLDLQAAEAIREMGGRKVFVETSGKAQYRATREFYLKIGYREAARIVDFYDVGDDKVIYEKTL